MVRTWSKGPALGVCASLLARQAGEVSSDASSSHMPFGPLTGSL